MSKEQKTNFYEVVVLVRQEASATQVDNVVKDVTDILKAEGGKVERTEKWGLRTLAYPINKARKAHYFMVQISAAPAALFELERRMKLNDEVVRSVSFRIDAVSEEESSLVKDAA
ncbi:MAG: 30S ribosomal protein S6 [Rickettsiales bacterium]|nr:30S ribosomal protein S6 [Rickettsiales bacterium]|tara:strand:- start:524 stop:868 length:345 start_codon:yes stop_codon:yes gene_type:complete